MSAATGQHLDHVLSDPSADATVAWQRGSYATDLILAARAHRASERSEAVAALERVREEMNRIRCEHDLHLTTWAILWQRVAGIVDGELARLRKGTA